ncbi:restriction endonuclease [uncultured Bacteroides sp.]|uniref:restriction endonuclease n=1 Tax=uncultured Bacteroides sp. TaxID=162156 RepID=UPI00280B64EC|nr:restriction endonuclease [uncultured Bacteroides sp.]
MKIIFEGSKYETSFLETYLNRRFFSPANNPFYSIVDYVGYYYNSQINDPVIILPKVFIYENGLAFGKYSPQDILSPNAITKEKFKKDGSDKLLFSISTWIYQAIIQFRKRQKETSIIENEEINNIISNFGDSDNTELDIILSLIKFHKENQQLFTHVSKLNHMGRKVAWNKTVSKYTPYLCDNTPIYSNVAAKKKTVDFDEELIVLFYSVLNYIRITFGFNIVLNQNYDLIKGREFERLLVNGTRKLKVIKNRYFTDKFVALWKLLYTFFEHSETNKKSNKIQEEVLLIKSFNIVFEDMIDDLIGDKNSDIPRYFSDQLDGKRVDHLYLYQSLIMNDKIYFVGDSKYYKPGNSIGKHSVEKQYTYARNIIQYNINLFNKDNLPIGIRYRDPLTEGYNITPNFFICAFVDPNFDFFKDGLNEEKGSNTTEFQYHFEGRLFDRDTLLIQRYNINFLFVLYAYTSRSSLMKASFKNKARKQFRDRMIDFFNVNYCFYTVTPISMTLEDFVDKYFRQLNGKMYRSSSMSDKLIVAIEKTTSSSFSIEDCICESFLLS